jgi:hypothetical protein
MEEQGFPEGVPQSMPPSPQRPPELTPEILEAMKARARQDAIQQVLEQRAAELQQTPQYQQPQFVYVRRNLTVAELGLIILISCGIVTGLQTAWNVGSKLLPQIEIKVK